MWQWVTPGILVEPDEVTYAARVAVRGRWFVPAISVFESRDLCPGLDLNVVGAHCLLAAYVSDGCFNG